MFPAAGAVVVSAAAGALLVQSPKDHDTSPAGRHVGLEGLEAGPVGDRAGRSDRGQMSPGKCEFQTVFARSGMLDRSLELDFGLLDLGGRVRKV